MTRPTRWRCASGTEALLSLPFCLLTASSFNGIAVPTDQNHGAVLEASPDATPIVDSTEPVLRVLLVDDHEVVRIGLREILKAAERVEIVGEASSGEEAVEKAGTLVPDLVVMDRAMPGMDGIEATRRITELELGAKILVLAVHGEDEFLVPALKAGATGFLKKSVVETDLIGAIETLDRGHSYLPQQGAALLAQRKTQGNSNGASALEVLSSRERTVIKLYANGFSTRELGQEMSLSPKTVEGHLSRAKDKLGLRTRREVVDFALEAGLLRAESER